ncbi:MAG: M4 family metallopeptidase [Hyphomicrobiaceae bacterium]
MSRMKLVLLAAGFASVCLVAGRPADAQQPPAQSSSPPAQDAPPALSPQARTAIETAKQINPGLNIKTDPRTGMPASVRGLRRIADPTAALGSSRTSSGPPSEDDVKRAAEAFFVSGELSAAFTPKNTQTRVQALDVRRDPDIPGQNVVQVEQRVNNVRVFGSSARVVVNPALAVTGLTASFSNVGVESTTPKIAEADAIATARRRLGELIANKRDDKTLEVLSAQVGTVPTSAELVVYDPLLMRVQGATTGQSRLAWLVSIETFRLFVDAENNTVLYFYRDHPTGLVRRVYDLASAQKFPGDKVIDEDEKLRKEPLTADANLAFLNTGIVRDFYFKVLGRDSYDDNDGDGPNGGAPFESYVRYSNIPNAYWCKVAASYCPKADVMVYGPSFAGALDVVGHEITHGVIAHERDLIYADEPGAVNESLADIFGTLIEFYADPANGNWVLGEKLDGFSLTQPLRSMADPHLSGPTGASLFDKSKPYAPDTNRGQPDHYSELLGKDSPLCDSTSDYFNGCVHFNSGILNKFAFLVSEGGRHRDVTVLGVGRNKLARMAYRALTTQLNPASSLGQAADGFLQACNDLAAAGIADFKQADCAQVQAAQMAVGLAAPGS